MGIRNSSFGRKHLSAIVIAAAAFIGAAPTFAQPGPGMADTMKNGSGKMPGDELSPELRKQLADMYRKMGDCLATTDKSMQACQKDVMKDCPAATALGYCPLADGIRPMKHGKHGAMNHPKMDHPE